jgi:hypothetical protein
MYGTLSKRLTTVDWEESPSSPTLLSKTNIEPAVVALSLVVHEETIEFNWANGLMVHLFGTKLEVVMISWITSFSS